MDLLEEYDAVTTPVADAILIEGFAVILVAGVAADPAVIVLVAAEE
jgi:hypothetical protein